MFWRRKKHEEDLERELSADLDLEIAEQEARGLSTVAARHAARRAFGNATLLKEELHAMSGWAWVESLLGDLRYAARTLRRNPGFASAAVLSLALAIGANTAIFTLLDAILLKSLPVRQPARLVQLDAVYQGKSFDFFSWPVIAELRSRTHGFSGVIAWSARRINVDIGNGPEPVLSLFATGNYYQVLGVPALVGRTIAPDDDRPGAPAVALLSYNAWQARFGGDPRMLGRTVRVERVPLTIVGVLPAWFTGTEVGSSPDIVFPVSLQPLVMPDRPMLTRVDAQWLRIMARLRDGVTEPAARAELQTLWPHLIDALDPNGRKGLRQLGIDVTSAATGLSQLREQFSRPLFVIMALVGLVLLMACTNVVNLLLARASARSREIAIRLAIGAGRRRLLRQLLTESLLLAAISGALGVFVAFEGSRALVSLLSGARGIVVLDLWPDARVLAFTIAVTLVTGVLFGLVPAIQATSSRIARRPRLLQGLVVVQIAVCLVLVTGAGLFVRSLQKLFAVNAGFEREGLLLVRVDPGRRGYSGAALARLYEQIGARLDSLPGARASSFSVYPPVQGNGGTFFGNSTVIADGRSAAHVPGYVWLNVIGPRFFETLGAPLLEGREFAPEDTATSPRVVVISREAARDYFGGGDAIGHTLRIGNGPPAEVIGIAPDVKYETLRESPHRVVYTPVSQDIAAASTVYLELRARGENLSALSAEVRRELRALVPDLPVETIPFPEWLDQFLVRDRLTALLAGGFGIIAIVLAAVGLYGLMAWTVAQRTREIGIRMALGAEPRGVRWQVMRESLLLALGGVAVGLPVVLVGGRLVPTLLFGLQPRDPLTFAMAAALLLAEALLAAYIPARRAARIDPMLSLRCE